MRLPYNPPKMFYTDTLKPEIDRLKPFLFRSGGHSQREDRFGFGKKMQALFKGTYGILCLYFELFSAVSYKNLRYIQKLKIYFEIPA